MKAQNRKSSESGRLATVVVIRPAIQDQQERRASNHHLSPAMEAGRMYAFEWAPRTDLVSWSEEYSEIVGGPKDNLPLRRQQHFAKVHPKDRDHFARVVKALCPEHPSYRICYRFVRPDRSSIWLAEAARAFFDGSGSIHRVVGITADVTDAKASEHALRELSGRLITSQEEERRRVARELHDNIGQELALVAMQSRRIDCGISDAQGTTHSDIHELNKRIEELSTNVSNLSHRLHSSELEYVGLASATDRFCRDFARKHDIHLSYDVTLVPRGLDKDIALCFYRLIQESLQNVIRHSKASEVALELTGGDELRLTVRDNGVGFQATKAHVNSGLGLVSMRERMHLIGGTFSIQSKPGQGTKIEATVALRAATSK